MMLRLSLPLACVFASVGLSALVRADEARDQFAVAVGHFDRQHWDLAVDEFRVFLDKHGGHPLAGNAGYFLGMAHVQLRQYEEARQRFRECLERKPEARKALEAHFRAGEMSYFLEDHEAARRELSAFREAHPDDALNAYALPYLADLMFKARSYLEAESLYREALKKYPNGPKQDFCRFGLAQALEGQGQKEEPALLYRALAAKASSPLVDKAQYFLGKRQFADGDFAAAEKTFADLEDKYPSSRFCHAARLGRGCTLLQQKQYVAARPLLESLTEHPLIGIDACFWLGATHKAQGNWDAAVSVLLAAVEREPKHARAPEMLFHAADALRMAGKHAEAQQQFDRVLADWPQHPMGEQCLLGKLRIAAALDDHEQITQVARRMEQEFAGKPSHFESARRLARSLLARGNYAAAAELLEPLLPQAKTPQSRGEIQQVLAEAYFQRRDHAKALATLKEVLESKATPDLRDEALVTKARILAADRQWAAAIQSLEDFLAQAPSGDRATACRAELLVCYVKSGQVEKALTGHAEHTAKQSDDQQIGVATLRLAEALYEAKQYPQAAELYKTLAHDPKHAKLAAEGLSGLGWSQLQAGLLPAAGDTFAELLKAHSEHPLAAEAALGRAQVLEQLGEKAQAAEAYDLVISHYGSPERLSTALLAGAPLHSKLGHHDRAAELYQRLLKEFPEHPQKDAALYQLAWAYQDQKLADAAQATFAQLHREHRGSRFWADATFRAANAALTAGRTEEAKRLLNELLASEPKGDVLAHAVFLQGRLAAAKQDWPAASESMQRLVREFPDNALRLAAEYWRAEATFQQGQHAESSRMFAELAAKVKDRDEKWVAMVPLRHAQALAHLDKWPEAQRLAETIAAEHPDFEAQYEVDYLLGRSLAHQAQFEEARAAYKRVTSSPTGGKTETAAMAQWMIGESYFHQKNYRAALNEYLRVEILYDYPKWQAAALLQAGKCCEHLSYWKLAAESYERIIEKFSQTEYKDEAAKRLETAKKRRASGQ
jgi:TolA-binding protein